MIALRGRALATSFAGLPPTGVWRLTSPDEEPQGPRDVVLGRPGRPRSTGAGFIVLPHDAGARDEDSIVLPPELDHLRPGDVIGLSDRASRIAVLWRAASSQNFLLLTERCDNDCVMCTQPPRDRDDRWLLDRARTVVDLIDPSSASLGLTGGEPTIYGAGFVDLVRHCRDRLPETALHVLSNGRRFADPAFAADYAAVADGHVMVGIPVYGSEAGRHDTVVRSAGAFDETIRGILNLAALDCRIEIRVVVLRETAGALPEIAEFIARNLTFVDRVALMGLELMGYARTNLDQVWIDPVDYWDELREAVETLRVAGVPTSIYNHQLCVIDPRTWPFAARSISDWKNEYHDVCRGCDVADRCGGFFHSSSLRASRGVHAVDLDAGDRDARTP